MLITTHKIIYDDASNITYYIEFVNPGNLGDEIGNIIGFGWFHDSGYDFEDFKNSSNNSSKIMEENIRMYKHMYNYLSGETFMEKLNSFVSIITILQTSKYQISNINYKTLFS